MGRYRFLVCSIALTGGVSSLGAGCGDRTTLCSAEAARCVGEVREICQDGRFVPSPCGDDESCHEGACLCVTGSSRCAPDHQLCDAAGTWRDEACGAEAPVCHDGTCVACAPGTAVCAPSGRMTCEDGAFVAALCPETAPQCFADGRCGLCLPGETRCHEGGLEICGEAGIDFLPSTCPVEAPLCIDGACAACPEEVVCAPSLISWGSTKIMVELLTPFSIYPVVYVEPSPPFLGEKGELAADVDGDGTTDLIAWRDSTIDVARGLANAFSSPASFFVGATASSGVRARLAGDVDGDGLGDLVEWRTDSVWVLLSTGGSFGSPTPWLQADLGGGPAHLLGDVDGDGRADLVAVTATGASVALSTGSAFTAPAVWSTEATSGAYGHHLGDFDADGRADLLTWGTFEKRISLSTGLDFTAPVVWADVEFYGVTAVPGSLVHDHDDDGDDDLLAISAVDIYVLPSDGAVLTVPYFQLSGSVYHVVDRGYHVGRSCAKVARCGWER